MPQSEIRNGYPIILSLYERQLVARALVMASKPWYKGAEFDLKERCQVDALLQHLQIGELVNGDGTVSFIDTRGD